MEKSVYLGNVAIAYLPFFNNLQVGLIQEEILALGWPGPLLWWKEMLLEWPPEKLVDLLESRSAGDLEDYVLQAYLSRYRRGLVSRKIGTLDFDQGNPWSSELSGMPYRAMVRMGWGEVLETPFFDQDFGREVTLCEIVDRSVERILSGAAMDFEEKAALLTALSFFGPDEFRNLRGVPEVNRSLRKFFVRCMEDSDLRWFGSHTLLLVGKGLGFSDERMALWFIENDWRQWDEHIWDFPVAVLVSVQERVASPRSGSPSEEILGRGFLEEIGRLGGVFAGSILLEQAPGVEQEP